MDRLFYTLVKRSKIVFKPFFILGNIFILPGDKKSILGDFGTYQDTWTPGPGHLDTWTPGPGHLDLDTWTWTPGPGHQGTGNKVTFSYKSYIQLQKLHSVAKVTYTHKSYMQKLHHFSDESYMQKLHTKVTFSCESYI